MEFSRIVELKFQKSQYIWYNYIFGNFQEFQVLELSSTIVVISSAGKLWIEEGFCYLEKGSWFERPFLSLNETTSLGLRLETRFVSSWHFNSQKIRQPSNDHDHHFFCQHFHFKAGLRQICDMVTDGGGRSKHCLMTKYMSNRIHSLSIHYPPLFWFLNNKILVKSHIPCDRGLYYFQNSSFL